MKFLLASLGAALVLGAATTNRISITWDNQSDYDTNVDFHIYSKTNLNDTSWAHLTNVTWMDFTNWTWIEIPPAGDNYRYFVVTASNIFGESDFSDPVFSRRLPRGTGLKIGVLP